MKVVLITAIGKNGEIGLDNQLLWKSPSDLARFKELTEGYPIIMGRKTFESLPGILPNRKHIVVSSNGLPDTENVVYESRLSRALTRAMDHDKVFIIGGASIYKQSLEHNLVDELLITHMNWEGQADKFFKPDLSKWKYVDTLASYSGEIGPTWTQKQYFKELTNE